MVSVAQWLERLTVDQEVVGSNPTVHPQKAPISRGFLFSPIASFGSARHFAM